MGFLVELSKPIARHIYHYKNIKKYILTSSHYLISWWVGESQTSWLSVYEGVAGNHSLQALLSGVVLLVSTLVCGSI